MSLPMRQGSQGGLMEKTPEKLRQEKPQTPDSDPKGKRWLTHVAA